MYVCLYGEVQEDASAAAAAATDNFLKR